MPRLINKNACKQFLLDQSIRNRAGKFTRVSASIYDVLEAKLRDIMRGVVAQQPSIGKTIK